MYSLHKKKFLANALAYLKNLRLHCIATRHIQTKQVSHPCWAIVNVTFDSHYVIKISQEAFYVTYIFY
jgi:hypothetical protein